MRHSTSKHTQKKQKQNQNLTLHYITFIPKTKNQKKKHSRAFKKIKETLLPLTINARNYVNNHIKLCY